MNYDITEVLGMNKEFQPNYQNEKPLEFAALVDYYLERYSDFDRNPESYWSKHQYAVKYANKSLMLEKLGLEDVESKQPDLFKSVFGKIAEADSKLVIKSNRVFLSDSLMKSMVDEEIDRNTYYETIWKKAYDTIKEGERLSK